MNSTVFLSLMNSDRTINAFHYSFQGVIASRLKRSLSVLDRFHGRLWTFHERFRPFETFLYDQKSSETVMKRSFTVKNVLLIFK